MTTTTSDGYPLDEPFGLLGGQDRPGGVVRGAQQDHPGPGRHRCGHGVEVVAAVTGQRDPDALGAGQADADRVGLEGAPGVDDLVGLAVVVLPGEGGQQLVEGAEAAGAGDDVLGRNVQELGERAAQLAAQRIRVAVEVGLRRDGLLHCRNRWQRVFVGGKLVADQAFDGDWRLAGRVAGKEVYHRTWADAPGRVV